jgi:hypothetical protein
MENIEEDRLLRGREPCESVTRFMLAYCSGISIVPRLPCSVSLVADFAFFPQEENWDLNETWFTFCRYKMFMHLPRALIGPTFLVFQLSSSNFLLVSHPQALLTVGRCLLRCDNSKPAELREVKLIKMLVYFRMASWHCCKD